MEKNEALLKEALSLLPKVKRSRVNVCENANMGKPMGEHGNILLDMGRHLTGYLHLKLGYLGSHPDAPVKLKIHFAERLQELEEDADGYHGWICSSWIQQEQIFVDVIPGMVHLPRRYAFRYVRIEVLAISSKFQLTVDEAYATALTSADETALSLYESQDYMLEKMDRVACHTLRDCMQQVFEDGPKRDRRLWMGDLRLQALANYETYHMNDMVKGCLYLFAALPMENGQVGACLFLEPEPEVDDTVMFDYSLLFIATVWDYYQKTGDKKALEKLWQTSRRQIDIAEERVDAEGLVKDSDVLGWCFLDWSLDLNKQAGAQGVLLYALKNAICIAETLGLKEEQEILQNKYDRYRASARKYLWDANNGLFVSGKERQISYASQIWMILGGAVSTSEGREILNRLQKTSGAIGMVTPYLYHHYIQAKLLVGQKEEALQVMKDYWGAMVELGADTFWELFNPKNPDESPYGGTIVNSYCHAWSCAPAYFLRKYFNIGGVSV